MSQCQEQAQTDNFCSQQQIVTLHSLNGWVSTDYLSALKAKSFFVYVKLMPLIPAGTQLCTGGFSLALLSWYQAVRKAKAYFSFQVRGRRWQIWRCSAKMKQGSAEIPSCQEACRAMQKCLCGAFICWHHLCWVHEDSNKHAFQAFCLCSR